MNKNKKIKDNKIIIAVPKGRILNELIPIFKKLKILPEKDFFN